MPKCPTCAGALNSTIIKYKVDPKPHAMFLCSNCGAAIAQYRNPQGEDLFVSFAESPIEPWDEFVARKWEEHNRK